MKRLKDFSNISNYKMCNIQKGMELINAIDKKLQIDEEYYLPIMGYINYSVSTCGNVRNDKTGRILRAGKNSAGYYQVVLCENGNIKTVKIHKLVANTFINNPKHKLCVDHMDRNKLNNHMNNLRFATHAENQHNKSKMKNNSSGFIGVYFHKPSKKWMAYIQINGKLKNLGYFETREEASFAYQESAREYFGEFHNSDSE